MWGPAPAITPGVSVKSNSSNVNSSGTTASNVSFSSILQGNKDAEGESSVQNSSSSVNATTGSSSGSVGAATGSSKSSKSKKKKGKRVLDTSLLGFTVQADPERKSGEIAHLDE